MFRRLLVSTVLVALSAGLLPATEAAAAPTRTAAAKTHLVRFNGIGKLKIGMKASKLRKLGYQGSQLTSGCRQYSKPSGAIYVIVDRRSRVVSIMPNDSGAYRTKAGIRIGSTLRKLKRVYRHDRIESHLDHSFGQGSNGVLVSRKHRWLSFGIDTTTNRVTSIKVATRKHALYDEGPC